MPATKAGTGQSSVRSELAANRGILAAGFIGCAMSVGSLPSYMLGPLVPLLNRSLGWSTGDLLHSLSFLAAGIALGVLFAGWICDRKEPRLVATVSIASHGILFVLLVFAAQHSVLAFRAVCFLMGLLAGGTTGVIYTRIISARFTRDRGFALGFAMAGSGVAAFLAPYFVHGIGTALGWQAVFLGIALLLLCFVLPFIWFGTRGVRVHTSSHEVTGHSVSGIRLGKATRDPRFYLVMVPMIALGSIMGSVLVVTVPALIEQGVTPFRAAEIVSLFGIAQLTARIACGWLLDRARPAVVGLVIFMIGALGAACFNLGGATAAMIAVICIGIVNGSEIDMVAFMTARYFGVKHSGAIFGAYYSIYMATCIVGPMMGAALIAHGGYAWLFYSVSLVFALSAAAMLALQCMDRPSAIARTAAGNNDYGVS